MPCSRPNLRRSPALSVAIAHIARHPRPEHAVSDDQRKTATCAAFVAPVDHCMPTAPARRVALVDVAMMTGAFIGQQR